MGLNYFDKINVSSFDKDSAVILEMSARFRSADISNIMGSARRKKERQKEKKKEKNNNKTYAYPGNISQNAIRSDCHEWFQSSQALFSPWKFVGIRSSLQPCVNRVLSTLVKELCESRGGRPGLSV